MILKGICLLAASTARSVAYLQTMLVHDLLPESVILLGEETSAFFPPKREACFWKDIWLPDVNASLSKMCEAQAIALHKLAAPNINSDECRSLLQQISPTLVIYSGVSGQIVGEATLNLGMPFLHLHAGALPAYRGSTTLYYALLHQKCPSVSAILLNRHIDQGPLLARYTYPPPEPAMAIDHLYDPAIRADALVRVLRAYVALGTLPILEVMQDERLAHTYYVMHPVLKHLAIASLAQTESVWKQN